MHGSADPEKRIQIAGKARCGRQFAQDLVWLKVENVLRTNFGGGPSGLFVLELDRSAWSWELVCILIRQKEEYRVANRDLIMVLQPALFYLSTVDQSAVSALQVRDFESGAVTAEDTMSARNGGV